MTHGRPALCGTVRRCRLHGVAGRYRGPHTPRSVSCALALEADLLLQQETPLCGVPSPGDKATQTFHRLPASAAHSWVHRPDRFSRLLHLPSDLQGAGALLAHQVPSAGKYRRSPGQGGLPGPTNTAGACGELRDPGGRRRSHVSEQRERGSGQIERRDGGEGKGRKPRRRQQVRVSPETLWGPVHRRPELRLVRGEGSPTEEAGVKHQVFKKDRGLAEGRCGPRCARGQAAFSG